MTAKEILTNYSLNRTSCREGIINLLIGASTVLSEDDIRDQIEGNYDRSTFYRSFKTLEEYGIIRRILLDQGNVQFELSPSLKHQHQHAHFYCKECDTVECMDELPESVSSYFANQEGAEVST